MLRNLLNGHTLYLNEEDDQTGSGAPALLEDDGVENDADLEDPVDDLAALKAQLATQKKAQDTREAKMRRKYDREKKQLQKQLADLSVVQPEPEPTPTPEPETPTNLPESPDTKAFMQEQKRMQREMRESQKALDKMKAELADTETKRAEQEQARKEAERDAMIRSAVSKAGVLPEAAEMAFRFFRADTSWDDTYGEWAIKDGEDFLPIEDTIQEKLPAYLKPRRSRSGSGGGNTGAGKTNLPAGAAELKAAKAKLTEIQADFATHGGKGEYSMKDYLDQKKIVAALAKQ